MQTNQLTQDKTFSAMWEIETTTLRNGQIQQMKIWDKENILTYAEFIQLLLDNEAFRDFYTQALKDCPFEGFFWETIPVKKSSVHKKFEFVLVRSTILPELIPNPNAFKEHFSKATNYTGIIDFDNLGGDAHLIAPCPIKEPETYPHFAVFLRNAPADQVHALWQCLAQNFIDRINERTTWISTAGLGVSWLHLRLDSQPKYYRFEPYKKLIL